MSYCRFIDGDVYAYECEGGVQFWTAKEGLNRLCNTFNEAYQYAMFLRDGYGLDVPSYAIEALKADALDETRRICGPNSVVAELESDNAKLRELVGCYDSALKRMCDQTQGFYSQSDSLPCDGCVLGKGHSFDKCGIDELQEEARKLRIEMEE